MSDDFGTTPPPVPEQPTPSAWGEPTHYSQNPPPPQLPPAVSGLSDNAAAGLAYVTFIPAVIFLFLAPYAQKPFVKFHAIQEIGLTIIWVVLHFLLVVPILGWFIYAFGGLALFIVWVICIVKASQGHVFKLPFIGDFAAQQSGYAV
jgi:uncharacterized membrane protein